VQRKYALHLCVYHTLKTLKNSVIWFPLICRIHSHSLSVYSEHIRKSRFFLNQVSSETECHSFCYTGKKIHTIWQVLVGVLKEALKTLQEILELKVL